MYVTSEGLGLEFPNESKSGALIWVPMPRYDGDGNKTYYVGNVTNSFVIPSGAKNPEGGVAFASAVRAYAIMDMDVYDDGTVEKMSTEEQDTIEKYGKSITTGVVMHYRRIQMHYPYSNIWGDVFNGNKDYAQVVATLEPLIMEDLAKQ